MLRCCLGAYGRPNRAWMPSLGAGLIRLSQLSAALGGEGSFEPEYDKTKNSLQLDACTHDPLFLGRRRSSLNTAFSHRASTTPKQPPSQPPFTPHHQQQWEEFSPRPSAAS
jgi:hypothetical protein